MTNVHTIGGPQLGGSTYPYPSQVGPPQRILDLPTPYVHCNLMTEWETIPLHSSATSPFPELRLERNELHESSISRTNLVAQVLIW